MTSIPPPLPVVQAAPSSSQPPLNSVSKPDLHSFAAYLKISEPEPEPASTLPKLSEPKVEKNAEKEPDRKKKSSHAEAAAIPIAVTQSAEAKRLQLSLPMEKQQATTSPAGGVAADAIQGFKTSALKTNGETLARSPIAFGVHLSKEEGAKTQGNQPAAAAGTQEALKPTASKSFSGKQQQQPSTSPHENQTLAGSSKDVKPATAPIAGNVVVHSAKPASDMPAPNATAQNVYAPAQNPTAMKTTPAASAPSATEPVETPPARPQNIDLKITGTDNSSVDIRVSQRAGDIQVTVRTPDKELAQSLRQHLPELSDRLSQGGISGEIWQPQSANTGRNDTNSRYPEDSQTRQQGQQHSGGNSEHGDQQHDGNQTAHSAWLNELNQANKENS